MKKHRLALFARVLISALSILCNNNLFAQGEIIYEDNFSDNSGNWGTNDNENILLNIQNGKYFFDHKQLQNAWLSWKTVTINSKRNFRISCNSLWVGGIDNHSYGLVWGLSDVNNYCSFGISANGSYRYSIKAGGTFINPIDWTKSELINKNASNKIEVRKTGGIIEFYINDIKVNQSNFEDFFGNNVGFNVNRNQKVLFDNLLVEYTDKVNTQPDDLGLSSTATTITDQNPPQINILQPAVTRGITMSESQQQILVRGIAEDKSGIREVTINGVPVETSPNGNFQQYIKLADGSNIISIIATDNQNNTGTFSFFVNRQDNIQTPKDGSYKPERRIALVIGNSAYGSNQTLKNPVNDARLMSKTLRGLDFEVIEETDASKQKMEQAIRDFSRKLPDFNVALFYFAGHGVQVDGQNYLIPTDAVLTTKSDCKFEAIPVNFIVEEFEKYPDNVNIVILDACRNNPFRSWVRGGEQGFRYIAPASGTIISFATSEGSTASDGEGDNGLFTSQLVKQISKHAPVESVFKRTRVEVEKMTNGAQSPQEWSKLKGEFYFQRSN